MGCCEPRCPMNYHFMCARNAKAEFQDDKKVYCAQHSFRTKKEVSRFFNSQSTYHLAVTALNR